MKKNININLTFNNGEFTDISILTDGLSKKLIEGGLDAPATLKETIGILMEELRILTEEKYNIGDKVLVDDEFICTIVDICSDSGVIYYEVKCEEFNTFNRHVKIDQIKEVK